MKMNNKGRACAICVIAIVAMATDAQTWKGVTSDGAWSNPANWDPTLPASNTATQLTFDLASTDPSYTPTNDFTGTFVLNRITLSGSGDRQIAGNPLQFSANAAILPELSQTGPGFNATLANPLVFANDTTVRIATLQGRVNLTGDISGQAALTFAGVGGSGSQLTLSGNNSYAGGTHVTGGILTAAAPHSLGTGPVDANGGRLIVPAGAANALTGSASLSVRAGEVQLSTSNDYTGGTTLVAGGGVIPHSFTIRVHADNALGSGPVFLNDGQLWLDAVSLPNTFNLTSQSVIFAAQSGVKIGSLTGSGAVTSFLQAAAPAVTITRDLAPAGPSPTQPAHLNFGDIGGLDPNLVDLVLTPTSAVRIDLTGPGANDLVQVSRTVTLDGNLVVNFAPGYAPAIGSTFDVMTFVSRNGTFDAVTSDVPGAAFSLQYFSDRVRVRVTAVPEPALLGTLTIAALATCSRRRRCPPV